MKKFNFALCLIVVLFASGVVHADETASPDTPPTATTMDPTTTPVAPSNWFSRWMNHVSEIQAQQPKWVTPVVTVTPRLEQEFRTDFIGEQTTSSGHKLMNYGNGKGLELIPFDNTEVVFDVPPYLQHNNPKVKDGFGDFATLLKYRIISSPESQGNYIVTAFLGVSIPTGQTKNGSPATIYTPTIAAGHGCGIFDVQSTLGVSIPDIGSIGKNILWNTAFQAHVDHYLWPELEFNYTHYTGGVNVNHDQLFITPGFLLGRFPLKNRLGLTLGGGFQIAATSFHTYDHAWIASLRLPF